MHDFLGFDAIVCERLTVTLLQFLWQGAAIGVVAAVLSQMLFRASSQVRYITHFMALFAMLCCLPITFSLVTVPEPVMVTAALETKAIVSMAEGGDIRSLQLPIAALDANPILIDPNAVPELAEEGVSSDQPISQPETPTVVTTISGEADPESDRYLPRLAPYVTIIYLAGVVLLLVRLVRSARVTRQLGNSAILITECDLLDRMRIQAERLGLRVLPALRWCNKVPVPVVIGVFRPVILLPAFAATGLTIDQLQAVMAHELAHIRRYDPVLNVLQRVIESLLFFHPAVWWVSRQITNEREHACDELVLTAGPCRIQYADALVRMAELSCQRGQLPVTALAATGSSTTAFKRRVLKVLEIDTAPTLRPSRIAVVMASLVVLFALAIPLFLSGSLAGGHSGEAQNREEIVNQRNLITANGEPVSQSPAAMVDTPRVELVGLIRDMVTTANNLVVVGAPRVELIGLTWDKTPRAEIWNPNGQPMPTPEWVQKLPKLDNDDKGKPAPLYLFEIHGLRAKPSFRHRYPTAFVSGDDELPQARPYRMAVLYEGLKQKNPIVVWGEHPSVRITDEPWGPWRTITKEGRSAGDLDPAILYREGYELVTAHGIRPLTKRKNDPEPTAGLARTGLVLTYPHDYDSFYAIEFEGVPADSAQPNVRLTNRTTAGFRSEQNNGWIVVDEWPVDVAKLDHIRFRIRPYPHRFEFQEVSHEPHARTATSAPFKTIYRKVEHDLPKPVRRSQTQSQKFAHPRLPGDSYTQAGVPRDKLAEADKKRLASAPLGDVQEPPENERGNGPLVLGLRIAGDADWWIGGQVKGELTVRNTSDENVLFKRAPRSDIGLSVVAIDPHGKEHQADFAQFDGGWPVLYPILLPPGHIMTVKEFTLQFDSRKDGSASYLGVLPLPTGDYTLKFRWHDARPEVAHEDEWTGELTSVAHKFQLAAADEPLGKPLTPEDPNPPRVELVGLTWDKAPKNDAWQPNGSPMPVPDWVKSIPELAPAEKKGPGAAMFLIQFLGLKAKPSIYFHERVEYQSGDESPRQDGSWRRAILYADALMGTPEWGSPPTLSLSDEPWGPWQTVTTEGQLVPPADGDRTYRLGYKRITFHGVRPLKASPHANDPLPPNAHPLSVVQHQPQGFRYQYAIEVEGALKGDGTQPQRYEPITPRFFERFAYQNQWNYELDWPFDPTTIDHLRFRIRPYRHQFLFENVNYAPSQNPANYSPFKTVYKKLEHDLPRPLSGLDE